MLSLAMSAQFIRHFLWRLLWTLGGSLGVDLRKTLSTVYLNSVPVSTLYSYVQARSKTDLDFKGHFLRLASAALAQQVPWVACAFGGVVI
jgi:hypothetical protein